MGALIINTHPPIHENYLALHFRLGFGGGWDFELGPNPMILIDHEFVRVRAVHLGTPPVRCKTEPFFLYY